MCDFNDITRRNFCPENTILYAAVAKVAAAWQQRAPTLEATRLGGGVGFHGWPRE
ncbi:MAG: hypothetical protein H7Z38_02645 [Rubrivivax sp.]|nr:hypothetical protein [Pyrinomonadaceae bacterium]